MLAMARFRHILVATDFSETSEQALALAIDMARESGCEMTVVHTCEIPTFIYTGQAFTAVDLMQPITEFAEKKLETFMSSVRDRYARAKGMLQVGTAWEQILAAAAEICADLVVIGTHGRTGIAHAVVGSVAEKVVRLSPIPVLTVRGRPPPRHADLHTG